MKESNRVKPYHPRAAHKEGCLCAACKRTRAKLASPPPTPEPLLGQLETIPPPPTPAPPVMVRIDSLAPKARFKLRGHEHMVKEYVEGMVVCYNLAEQNAATLGGSTMVEPI